MTVAELAKFLLENFAPDVPVYAIDEFDGIAPIAPSQFTVEVVKRVKFMDYEQRKPALYLTAAPARIAIDTITDVPCVLLHTESSG